MSDDATYFIVQADGDKFYDVGGLADIFSAKEICDYLTSEHKMHVDEYWEGKELEVPCRIVDKDDVKSQMIKIQAKINQAHVDLKALKGIVTDVSPFLPKYVADLEREIKNLNREASDLNKTMQSDPALFMIVSEEWTGASLPPGGDDTETVYTLVYGLESDIKQYAIKYKRQPTCHPVNCTILEIPEAYVKSHIEPKRAAARKAADIKRKEELIKLIPQLQKELSQL